jgi:DNA polymerase-1
MTDDSLRNVSLGYIETLDDVGDFLRWASERHDCLAIDTETSGLSPYDKGARIRLIQIGDRQTGWAMPFNQYAGLAAEVIRNFDGPIVYHNAAFDIRWLDTHASWFPKRWDQLHDTMIAARLISPNKSAALKRITYEMYGSAADLGQRALKEAMERNDWTWDTVPLDYQGYTTYSALDVVLTARVFEKYLPWITAHREVFDLEMDTRRICTNMELKGFKVDLAYTNKKHDQLLEYYTKVQAWGKAEHGIEIGSPTQLAKWIISNGGVIDQFTPKGSPQADKTMLEKLGIAPDTPDVVRDMASQVLKARKAEKIATTYLENFVKFADANGFIHANINTLQARTSRMSVTEPAFQTLPRDDTTVRHALVPDTENEALIFSDYSQIEARLTAHFSGDRALIAAFEEADRTGGDFFTEMGKRIYGAGFTRSDKRRALVKNVTYASAYGAGIPKMALTAGVPLSVMEPVARAIFDTFPGIRGIGRIAQHIAETHTNEFGEPVVITPTGREIPVPEDKLYVSANYLIQGHAAEVLKLALTNLDNLGLGDMLRLPIHDELALSVPRDQVEDVKPIVHEAMTMTKEHHAYKVQLPADPDGPWDTWGQAKEA